MYVRLATYTCQNSTLLKDLKFSDLSNFKLLFFFRFQNNNDTVKILNPIGMNY